MNDDYMISFQNETKQTIEASYKKMTAVERSVADFFIGNKDDMDFSSKNISRVLYVSEATLSRFSKKCGYKGYREFIFSYERDLKFEQKSEGTEKDVGLFARRVQNSYQKLLQENFRILDEDLRGDHRNRETEEHEPVDRDGFDQVPQGVTTFLESEIPVMQRKNSSCVSCVSGWMLMQLQIPI